MEGQSGHLLLVNEPAIGVILPFRLQLALAIFSADNVAVGVVAVAVGDGVVGGAQSREPACGVVAIVESHPIGECEGVELAFGIAVTRCPLSLFCLLDLLPHGVVLHGHDIAPEPLAIEKVCLLTADDVAPSIIGESGVGDELSLGGVVLAVLELAACIKVLHLLSAEDIDTLLF